MKKKKAFEDLAQYLRTDEHMVANYKGNPITTTGGPCVADSIANGTIS